MKSKVACIIITALLLLAGGCSEQEEAPPEPTLSSRETAPRQLTLSSLYDVEADSFILDGYAPETGWRELCEALDISLDGLKEDEYRYYIKNVIEIFPNSDGFICYGAISLDGRPASVTYEFYREKLCGVQYDFELEGESNEERAALATELDAELRENYSDLKSDSDRKLGGTDYAYRVWFAGKESAMSCLRFSTSTDSVSGELRVTISVTCDIPEKELATTHYTDRFGDNQR